MKSGLYKKILTQIPEGVLILDKDFNVVFANDWFKKVTKKDVIEGKVNEFLENYYYDNTEDEYAIRKFDIVVDNEKLAVKVNTKKVDDGYVVMISLLKECICLDVIHNDFISTVSHEMRTPLTSMKGFIDTILSAGDKLDASQKDRFLKIVKQQIERLTRLVENLLTVSRLENKKIKDVYKSLNVIDLSKIVVDELKSKHPNHIFVVIENNNVSNILADYDKAHQVLTNLIDNAAKYSQKNTTIEIKAQNKPDNDFVEISIKDQGIGIPQEYIGKIFSKFLRIDNPLTREVQGTGLGLYITKTLIDSMGGVISVESELDKGTTFSVDWPVATTESQAKKRFLQDAVK
ncbi:MAG: ATP-binding protein [Candidatus Gastranaerophilales bacterium]|nr:ATP-binding protein [Candidatus Gastranaerophilales bacterium]